MESFVAVSLTKRFCALLNRPERKRLSCLKARILMIGEIKPAMAIRPEMGFIFSETESIECVWILFGSHLNRYEVLIT